jgi:CBS domain-containing protein
MRARDVMTLNVVSVSPDSPISEVVRLLLRYRISAMPVVDAALKVVGVVSEGDLLRLEGARTRRSWWLEALASGRSASYEKARGRTAGEVMTRDAITVGPETPLEEIAALLERHHIKRVPVVEGGRLAGIVSRANLLHGLANTILAQHEPGAEKDRDIRVA